MVVQVKIFWYKIWKQCNIDVFAKGEFGAKTYFHGAWLSDSFSSIENIEKTLKQREICIEAKSVIAND